MLAKRRIHYSGSSADDTYPSSSVPTASTGDTYIFNNTTVINQVDPYSAFDRRDIMERVLPERESIRDIIQALSPGEKDDMLKELFNIAVMVVKVGTQDYIEALRQVLVSWEYSAIIKNNNGFLEFLDSTKKEIEEDDSPGVEWRELLGR